MHEREHICWYKVIQTWRRVTWKFIRKGGVSYQVVLGSVTLFGIWEILYFNFKVFIHLTYQPQLPPPTSTSPYPHQLLRKDMASHGSDPCAWAVLLEPIPYGGLPCSALVQRGGAWSCLNFIPCARNLKYSYKSLEFRTRKLCLKF